MAVRIRSLQLTGPLLLPLSGGGTLRLSPGQVSDELDEVRVADNAKVDKLVAQRLIAVEKTDEKTEAEESSPEKSAPDEPAPKPSRRSTRQR